MNAPVRKGLLVLARVVSPRLHAKGGNRRASAGRPGPLLVRHSRVCPAAGLLVALALLPLFSPAAAQVCCPSPLTASFGGQEYRIVYQTVYEPRQETVWRVEYETVCEERQVTTYRPVWETQMREYRYTVAKPVVETSTREERYTVYRPVWETQMRDCSYNRVRYITETAEREERYVVERPVWETAEREECYTVMKPVVETTYRTEYQTVMKPVTTCRTQYVDQGGFVDQVAVTPMRPANRLRWLPPGCEVDPLTGAPVFRPRGLYWVQIPRTRYEVQRVWQPNVVAQQVPVTTYVPQTVARQVPVQVCRYEAERVVRKVPVQVCRMVREEHVRKVPYTVTKPVVERVERQVPVQVCRMVAEQRVCRIPVTTCRTIYEQRVEQRPVQVCRMVAVQETVRVPRCVEKRTPLTCTYYVPRVVCCRVPLDPCGVPVADYCTPAVSVPSEQSGTTTPTPAETSSPTPAQPPAQGTGPGEADVPPSLNNSGDGSATPEATQPSGESSDQPVPPLEPLPRVPTSHEKLFQHPQDRTT